MKKHIAGRIASVASAAALAASALGTLPSLLSAQAAGLTGLDAKGITSQMIIGWNLGNTLDCSNTGLSVTAKPEKFAKAWGQPAPNAEQFQAVKDGGFNTVRIPTTWYEHLVWDEDSQMYLVSDTWMDYVKQTVDYAYDRDMFVILNVHHEEFINAAVFTDESYAEAEKKLTDIWTQVAETFKDYDQHLIFEGMNEPRQTGNPSVNQWGNGTDDNGYTTNYINNLNKAFVDTIRGNGSAANSERLLMLPGYAASSDATAIRNIAIPENAGNVALSVHAYAPYYFCMATDEKACHEFPGKSGWGEDYEYSLTNLFNTLDQIQKDKNVPIIIGEFSASDFENTEDRCRWATSYLSKAKAVGIPCVLWDNNVVNRTDGEAHGYLYRKGCNWYLQSKPVIEAMMAVYGITPTLPDYEEVTEPPFDFSKIAIGDNWAELYRMEEGKTLDTWRNTMIHDWKDYVVADKAGIAVIYESDSNPELVLQDARATVWNRIQSSDDSDTPYVMMFTYEDIMDAMITAGSDINDMANLYASATSDALTLYGVYAVPKEVVEDTTIDNVVSSRYFGDIDANGVIDVFDLGLLKKARTNGKTPDGLCFDCDNDGQFGVGDIIALQKYLLRADNAGRTGQEVPAPPAA